jgi:hypothetical protein
MVRRVRSSQERLIALDHRRPSALDVPPARWCVVERLGHHTHRVATLDAFTASLGATTAVMSGKGLGRVKKTLPGGSQREAKTGPVSGHIVVAAD